MSDGISIAVQIVDYNADGDDPEFYTKHVNMTERFLAASSGRDLVESQMELIGRDVIEEWRGSRGVDAPEPVDGGPDLEEFGGNND